MADSMNLVIRKSGTGEVVVEYELNSFSLTSGNAYFSVKGGFLGTLPLDKSSLYELVVITGAGVEDSTGEDTTGEEIILNGLFLDYSFNAGVTDIVSQDGTITPGVVTLANSLQFKVVG